MTLIQINKCEKQSFSLYQKTYRSLIIIIQRMILFPFGQEMKYYSSTLPKM